MADIENLKISDEKTENKQQEDPIYEILRDKCEEECIKYINEGKLADIDCTDKNGMTPLQYGAFRGYYKLCKLLIEKGADVNADTHEQGYSAIMFAAISNHLDVVKLLLDNDANTETKNSIGRTVTQMAAFVNSHEAVDLINNYISKAPLLYYTKINLPSEKEPKLPECCVEDLHTLVTSTNYHPIYLLKKIKKAAVVFLPNIKKILNTLDTMITKAFKGTECPNDMLSFKLHFYKFLLEYVEAQFEKYKVKNEIQSLENSEQLQKFFDLLMKQFLVEKISNSAKKPYREFEEQFLRESIRQFPYKECALLRQMVQILFKVEMGSTPTALYVITSCLNGQRFTEQDSEVESHKCAVCLERHAKLCSQCKKVAYCDQMCQKLHWSTHKKDCK